MSEHEPDLKPEYLNTYFSLVLLRDPREIPRSHIHKKDVDADNDEEFKSGLNLSISSTYLLGCGWCIASASHMQMELVVAQT